MSVGKKSRSQVAKSRPIVYKRDGYECVVAGLFEAVRWPCGGALTIQHRVGRGAGGSALLDEPKHLIAMCSTHNFLQTADAVFDQVCKDYGWSVPRWAADRINTVPVKYADGWHLLAGDSRYLLPAVQAEELINELYN